MGRGTLRRFSRRRHGPFSKERTLFRLGRTPNACERQGERKPSLLKRQRIARSKCFRHDSLPVHLCEDGGARMRAPARNEVAEMAMKSLPRMIATALIGTGALLGSLAPTLAADKVTLPHQLVRPGRAWRFLSGQGDRALRQGRARRHHQDGRPAGQRLAAFARRRDRFHDGLRHPGAERAESRDLPLVTVSVVVPV